MSALPRGLLATLAMLLCACEPAAPVAAVVGTLERDRIELRADSDEPLLALEVREGDRVEVGAVLARQDDRVARMALAAAEARRAAARAALDEAIAGPRAEAIARVRAQLTGARSAVALAESDLERVRGLTARSFETAQRLETLARLLDQARAERDALAAQLQELLAGTRAEVVARLRDELDAADQAVLAAELTLARTAVPAPVAAVVEALPFEIGERPPRGATVVALLAAGRTFARVYVPAPLRARLEVGDRALVQVEGIDAARQGRVRWIASEAAFTPFYSLTQQDRARLAYLAEVDLVDGADLPVGIPVEVRFEAAGDGGER
ncbi:MAG TPA: HlyD family efflux transporter periplasmic adaptor subunit [Pseudomonadales bacterium]|nr:HlyD family efflux transporter periplasmic adaptor subunit [Pseudomonadales bacterium]